MRSMFLAWNRYLRCDGHAKPSVVWVARARLFWMQLGSHRDRLRARDVPHVPRQTTVSPRIHRSRHWRSNWALYIADSAGLQIDWAIAQCSHQDRFVDPTLLV